MHICIYNVLIVIYISGFMVPIPVGYLSLTDATGPAETGHVGTNYTPSH